MNRHSLTMLTALLMTPHPALAQAAPPPTDAAPPPIQAPATSNAVLRSGTEVILKLDEPLTTQEKQLNVGQRFRLETAEPVMVQGVVVIPIGSPAIGEITEVRNKGMWGKSGHFTGQMRYVTVNGRQIRLSGTFDSKGNGGVAGAVAVSAIVFLPAGFFMTGSSARLPAGTAVRGFIDEDVPLSFASRQAPAPLQVTVPQSPMQTAPAK